MHISDNIRTDCSHGLRGHCRAKITLALAYLQVIEGVSQRVARPIALTGVEIVERDALGQGVLPAGFIVQQIVESIDRLRTGRRQAQCDSLSTARSRRD